MNPSRASRPRHRPVIAAAALLMLAGCQSAADRAASAMAQGQQLAAAGQYAQAQAQFDIAVKARDDLPELWMMRARNQIALQDYAGAFASYRSVLDQDRSNREALDAMAQLSLASKRLDEARDYAEQILSMAPDDPTGLLVTASVAFQTGRYDSAAAGVAKLLAQTPGNERALVLSSRLEERRGRVVQAIALLEPIFLQAGGGDELRAQMVSLYGHQANGPGLLAVATRDAADRPQDAVAQRTWGKQLVVAGQLGEAILAFDAAHKIAPGDSQRAATVRALADTGIAPATIADALNAASEPQSDLALAIAEYAIGQGDYATGAAVLAGNDTPQDASKVDHDGALAFTAAVTGRMDEARQRARETLALDGGQPYALMARAIVAMAARNPDAALRDARQVVSDNPSFAPGVTLLSRVLTVRGDRLLAEKAYFDANNADRDDPTTLRQLAALLVSRGRTLDALDYSRNFTMRNPASLFGWTLRQDLCRRAGDAACVKRAATLAARLRGAKLPVPPVPVDERVGDRDYRDEESGG